MYAHETYHRERPTDIRINSDPHCGNPIPPGCAKGLAPEKASIPEKEVLIQTNHCHTPHLNYHQQHGTIPSFNHTASKDTITWAAGSTNRPTSTYASCSSTKAARLYYHRANHRTTHHPFPPQPLCRSSSRTGSTGGARHSYRAGRSLYTEWR